MSDRTKGPWKWHSRVEDLYGDGPIQSGSIFAEPTKGHAYSVAVAPKYQTDEQWRADAAAIVRWENHFDEVVKALEEVVEISKSGADTVSFMVELNAVAKRCASTLAKVKS